MNDMKNAAEGSAWTWKKPTAPGWFWYRPKLATGVDGFGYKRALHVYKMEGATELFVACDRFNRLSSPYYEGGQWQKCVEPCP